VTRGWAGQRALVTGHTGFKGGWLALLLQEMGAEVHGLALAPDTSPSFHEVCGLGQTTRGRELDVRDTTAVARSIAEIEPDVIFHLAAQSLVRRSYREPLATLTTNVVGTANVLEGVRALGRPCAVVVVTSDKCYANRGLARGYVEDDPLGGDDVYSASKGAAELMTHAWRQALLSSLDGVRVATARAGNVIGGGDWCEDRLVPDLMRAFAAKEVARIRRPDATRPWQHVLDAVGGYATLAERLLDDTEGVQAGWNFGPSPDDAWPVAKVAARVAELWGEDASLSIEPEEGAPAEAETLVLDASRAREALGWRPVWDLEGALERTVEWYRLHAGGEDMRAFSARQIAAHREAAPT
jgi:CDP-glucose 4,6-dehydratase